MWYWIADSQKSCTRKAARNYDSNVVTRTRKTFQSAAYKNMFFTTLLIDVTPLEYNELNAGVRSHKTEDKWPQKCTVVINTGFTKQKKKKDSEQWSPRGTEKTKKRGRNTLILWTAISDTHKDPTRLVDYYSQTADGVNEMYHQQKMGFVMTYDVFLWRMYRCYVPLVKQFTNVYVQAFLSGSTASAPNAISHRTTCRRLPRQKRTVRMGVG